MPKRDSHAGFVPRRLMSARFRGVQTPSNTWICKCVAPPHLGRETDSRYLGYHRSRRTSAATLLDSRRSSDFSPFYFPGCPFTRASPAHRPSNWSRTREHSRLRYRAYARARSLRRSDPICKREMVRGGRGRGRGRLVWHGPHSTRGVENRKWSIENGSCLGNRDLL